MNNGLSEKTLQKACRKLGKYFKKQEKCKHRDIEFIEDKHEKRIQCKKCGKLLRLFYSVELEEWLNNGCTFNS